MFDKSNNLGGRSISKCAQLAAGNNQFKLSIVRTPLDKQPALNTPTLANILKYAISQRPKFKLTYAPLPTTTNI